MNIQGFVGTNEKYSVEAIAQDSMLAYEIQEILKQGRIICSQDLEKWYKS
jgi:hypothetical protein